MNKKFAQKYLALIKLNLSKEDLLYLPEQTLNLGYAVRIIETTWNDLEY